MFATIISSFKKHGAVTIDTPVFELKVGGDGFVWVGGGFFGRFGGGWLVILWWNDGELINGLRRSFGGFEDGVVGG